MELLRIQFTGWTATPRMPFILSGNAICLPVPTYSLLLGLIGCCLGRVVDYKEINIGFQYCFDSTAFDIETRQRLIFDKTSRRIKQHHKGSDAYPREFHINPRLTLWLNRVDWKEIFLNPIGTPGLGRSQDLLKIVSVETVNVVPVGEGEITGTMIPFRTDLKTPGQLVQLAEAYYEKEDVGTGRIPVKSRIFLALRPETPVKLQFRSLFREESGRAFYLHDWK
ncbi:MAG TPA: hypothetical protein ENH49_04280 [Candidatus Marinimicrobia bacterium]|nr:hypothetical protein [candidate division Zixibacteria bacterium]HDY75721.1 hypothetical protein [Candidatus Neomarinimicrobiota bacterium]